MIIYMEEGEEVIVYNASTSSKKPEMILVNHGKYIEKLNQAKLIEP